MLRKTHLTTVGLWATKYYLGHFGDELREISKNYLFVGHAIKEYWTSISHYVRMSVQIVSKDI